MKRPSGCLLTVLAIPLGILLFYSTNYSKKPASFAHTQAMAVATDLRLPEEGYDLERARKRLESRPPACPRYPDQPEGEWEPYYSCVYISSDDWIRCGIWSREDCVALRASYNLITQPEAFAKVVDAMWHPCKYLPRPEEVAGNPLASDHIRGLLAEDWREARCANSPERYPGEVTLRLYDYYAGPDRSHIERLRIVKPAD